jgi:small subunit ribosomal protein S5
METVKDQKENKTSTPTTKPATQRSGSFKSNTFKPRARRGGRPPVRRAKPEFEQKIIGIRRVVRVVSGGRRFSFSVAMVAGDKKGKVGVGVGKSTDTSLAIEKAARDAKKNMIKVKLNKKMSIPFEVRAKFCSSDILIMPAPGKGLVAGSSARNVLDLAGITDVGAKVLSRSKNKINNARATIKALKMLDKDKKVVSKKEADKEEKAKEVK